MVRHTPNHTHTDWELVGPALAEHCTVYAIDRRGRGESGDADEYILEREEADVAEVVDAIDERAVLLGHSFGATCALEAALRTNNLHKLILYEPWIVAGNHELYPEAVLDELKTLLDDGENERALVVFLGEVVDIPQDEIEALRSTPNWQEMVDAAYALPREMQASAEYEFDADRFAGMTTPTLLLAGSESPLPYKEMTDAVDDALPDSRIAPFEGEQHLAMFTAPDRFVDEVLAFVRKWN